MSGYIFISGGGRFGNKIFQLLGSILYSIIYKCEITNNNLSNYYHQIITDDIFIHWANEIIKNNLLVHFPSNIFEFNGFYQHDTIFNKFKKELIAFLLAHPESELIFDNKDVNFTNINTIETAPDKSLTIKYKSLLGVPPELGINYKTIIHLRIEDFLYIGFAMNPKSIDKVLEKCEGPFLFVHKPVYTDIDKKYVNYFKQKYTDALFYDGEVIDCYNIMRNSEYLVCSLSSLSWAAAFFNENHKKIFMPKNNMEISHQTFQYPSERTEIYKHETLKYDQLINIL